MKNKNVFFFDLSEGMENWKKSGKNQGKVGEFRGGLQVTTLVILMIEILGYLCLFYCINILINVQVLTFTKKLGLLPVKNLSLWVGDRV